MKCKKNFWVSYLLCLFLIETIPLQAQQYVFQEYSLEQGLPQSEIWYAFQDSRHYLWVGTNGGGLCRFTGTGFEVFNKKTHNLVDNQVVYIYEDRQHHLWIGTFRGISHYDGKKFTNYDNSQGILEATGYSMWEDAEGRVWTFLRQGNKEQQIGYFESGKWHDMNAVLGDSLFENNRNTIFAMPFAQGRVLFFTNQGWYELTSSKTVEPSKIYPKGLSPNEIAVPLLFDKQQDAMWIGIATPQNPNQLTQIYHYHWKTGVKTILPIMSESLTINAFQSFYFQDSRGNLWWTEAVAQALGRYDGQRVQVFDNTNGLEGTIISTVLEDHEGNIWLATRGRGLVRYQGEQMLNFTEKDGISPPVGRSIFQDSKGTIWLGSMNGLSSYESGRLSVLFKDNLQLGAVRDIYEMPDGNFLLATVGNGLLLFDGKNATPANEKLGIPANFINISSIQLYQNSLFIGTFGGGLVQITDSIPLLFNQTQGQLTGDVVHSLFVDSNNYLWICTTLGLTRYDGKNFVHYTKKEGLEIELILQVIEDKKGNLWGATYGAGLVKFDGKKFVHYTEKEGLSSDITYSIAMDKDGNFWVGTQKGVDKISLDAQGNFASIRNYNEQDGLVEDETNGVASFIDKDGNFWVGTLKGFSRLQADKLDKKTFPPLVRLNRIDIFNKQIDWQSPQYQNFITGLSPWNLLPENLVLPYHINQLTFVFEAVSYANPLKIQYQWKLEGFDKDWTPVSPKTEAVYTNLPPGRYTFLLKAQNADGVWSAPIRFSFEITAPFWQKWWFRVMLMGVFLGATFGGFKWRISAVEAKKRKLEQLVKQKTLELQQQHDEILVKNAILEQQKEEILVQNEQIHEQHFVLEQQHQDIHASISYAQQIQQAMLPNWAKVQAVLPETFLLFKPLQWVSGDFYWFAHLEEEQKMILAVVDCTGHGVPGAFMSMLGDAYLNQIIKEKRITDPATILEKLHQSIRQALQQSENMNRDGMDMVLVVIDTHAKELLFAGAKNPLIYFQDSKMYVIKGNKLPIGGIQVGQARSFVTHRVSLEQPTTFYLFSDGFQDQFGGETNKKFMVTHFRQLLHNIHQVPMLEQKEILEKTLEKWIKDGKQTQIDDILVWGVRINS